MGPTNKDVWDEEIPVPENTISYVDSGIIRALPANTQILGISPSGESYWARTAKIDAWDAGGKHVTYFLKVHQGELGRRMVSAEYISMVELYKAMPEIIAKPIAWGRFEELHDTHFLVSEFHNLSDTPPDIKAFPALVAELHKRTKSPCSKFGFAHETFGGRNVQVFPESDTWAECFGKGMDFVMAAELATQGPDAGMEALNRAIQEKLIPRLLGALESGGRQIIPCLVHGDLWEGNTSVDVTTGRPMIFDPTPLYAHNEYELGPWLCPRHKFVPYIDEYKKHFDPSAPKEEFGDRIELYCLRFDMHASSLYPGKLRFRAICKDTMKRLLAKYVDGYENPTGPRPV